MLHGSGAGVSGWANWRGIMPMLAEGFRVIVPDLVGFGYTETPDDLEFTIFDTWLDQMIALLDGLGIDKVHLVGNSFGGRPVAAPRHEVPGPGRSRRPHGRRRRRPADQRDLEALWTYKPSVENMKRLMDIMAYDRSLVTDELRRAPLPRHDPARRPGGVRARVSSRRCSVISTRRSSTRDALRAMPHQTLILHGRDDASSRSTTPCTCSRRSRTRSCTRSASAGTGPRSSTRRRFHALVSDFLREEALPEPLRPHGQACARHRRDGRHRPDDRRRPRRCRGSRHCRGAQRRRLR